MTCRTSANGYEALPGNEVEDGKKAAREQEELEDRYEKMLMDVYDTLYKVPLHHLMLSSHHSLCAIAGTRLTLPEPVPPTESILKCQRRDKTERAKREGSELCAQGEPNDLP